jgi:hypothetical protein
MAVQVIPVVVGEGSGAAPESDDALVSPAADVRRPAGQRHQCRDLGGRVDPPFLERASPLIAQSPKS